MENQNFPNYIANGFVVHNSGATQIYTKAKEDNNSQAWNNEIMDKITERTHGVIIYQEQTMSVARQLGFMEWDDISHIRLGMSKSMGKDYFELYRKKFVDGAITKGGVDEEFANHVFDHICTLGKTSILMKNPDYIDGVTGSGINKILPKRIDKVKVGDQVLSYNEKTGDKEFKKVKRVFNSQTQDMLDIKFSNNNRLTITGNHPIFVIDKGWTRVDQLVVGDECIQKSYATNRFALLDKTCEEIMGADRTKTVKISREKSCYLKTDRGRKEQSERMTKKNPMWHDEVVRSSFSSRHWDKPTQLEKNFLKILDANFPNHYRYTGDGKFWIEKANPDFVNVNGQKKVIEIFTAYYKVRDFGSVKKYIKVRSKQYAKYGWTACFIEDHELEDMNKAIQKIKQFTYNPDAEIVKVESIIPKHFAVAQNVYNLEVEDNNNYFAYGILVHNCLVSGTKIICQDKNKIVEKNIEDVKVGDIAVSLDRDFSMVYNPVSRVYENATIHLMSITFSNGVNVKCTPSHPFYVAKGFNDVSANRWIKAMDLSIGDECLHLDSSGLIHVAVQSVNFSTLKDWQKVYNLEVEFTHNYFANGINMENCTHGQWSFNRGHSVSYTDVSYKMAYLKAHYPRHFYYGLLMNEDVEEKVNGYLRDYIEKGYGRVLPPKLNHSDLRWKLEGNDLRAGLTQVKGLGEKAAEQLISLYPIKDMEDLKKRVTKRVVNIRVIRLIEEYKMLTDEEDVDVFGLYDFADRMKNIERSHRIGDITYQFKARPVLLAGFIPMQINQKNLSELEVSVALKDYSRYNKANGDEFAIFYVKDETQQIQVIVDNKLYPKVKDLLWSCKIGSDIIRIKGNIPPSKMFVNLQEVEKYNDVKYSGSKCYKCPLAKNSFVPPFGSKTSSIMIVGEAPGAKEEEKGQPFVGRSGSLLGDILAELGLDRSHLYISNSVFCRPTDGNKNRTPTDEEINCCRGHLEWEIDEVKPKVVITMGKIPLAAMLNKKIEEIKISKMVESVIDLETLSSKYKGVLLIPSYHPAAALYSPDSGYRDSIKNSIQLALDESNKHINKINKLKISREKRENSGSV
jgi:DNA polymerase